MRTRDLAEVAPVVTGQGAISPTCLPASQTPGPAGTGLSQGALSPQPEGSGLTWGVGRYVREASRGKGLGI